MSREALAHVIWIGGGPQAGKTCLSRMLAGKWDLKIYALDWHLTREHRERAGPRARAFGMQTMDERWAMPSVDDLVRRTTAIWAEIFELVIRDLLTLPRSRTIVAEGPGAPPWLVTEFISSPRQAIFLVPTQAHRDRVEEQRFGAGQLQRFPGIVDRSTALSKVRARDAILDRRIADSCATLGLRSEVMNGSRDIDASLALIEDHFRPFLPATPNV